MKNVTPIRHITPEDCEIARNIRKFYSLRKQTDGLTQTQLAKAIGVNQSAISQMMLDPPRMALRNVDTLTRLANALRIPVEALNPRLKLPHTDPSKIQNTPVLYAQSGEVLKGAPPKILSKLSPNSYYGVRLDYSTPPFLAGHVLLVGKRMKLVSGKFIVVQKKDDSFRIGSLVKITPTTVRTIETIYPIDALKNFHLICGVEF